MAGALSDPSSNAPPAERRARGPAMESLDGVEEAGGAEAVGAEAVGAEAGSAEAGGAGVGEEPMEGAAPAPFWGEDPNVLLDGRYAAEFFPVDSMDFNRRLNAVTRVVLALTAVSFLMTRNLRLLAVSAMTLVAIFVLHRVETDKAARRRTSRPREGFDALARRAPRAHFQPPSAQNPFANVLPGDYADPARKLPAAPSDDPVVAGQVLAATRRMIEAANPGQPDIADRLFQDLGEQLNFEQSMRPFYSTASTTIPNDRGAFMDFCYGDMASCKDGNAFACARATANHAMI